ncbi:hypothetical protein QTV44_002142 [Vibrio vulnificus]|nr:hypothetical protein [Vibrio vulnificus]
MNRNPKTWIHSLLLCITMMLTACGGGGSDGSAGGNTTAPATERIQAVQHKAISVQFDAPKRINSQGTLEVVLSAFSQEQGELTMDWKLPEGFSVVEAGDDDSDIVKIDDSDIVKIKAPKVTKDQVYQIAVEITDSANNLARYVHDIKVLRKVSTVTITGMVTDSVIANANVTAVLNGQALNTVQADANGQYVLELDIDQLIALSLPIELRASGVGEQAFVEFRSIIPSLTSLIAQSGQTESEAVTIDTSVDFGVNITNVTSAVSSLIASQNLQSDQALNQALLSVDTQEVLRRATLIKLVVDKPAEYQLPSGVENTLAFMSNTDALQSIETQATQSNDFAPVQQQILQDTQLVSDNAQLSAAEYIVQLAEEAFVLQLNADGTGSIYSLTGSELTWTYANRLHTISISNPVETYRDQDGWLKRLKKIELQVVNQSHGRAMAKITRVFDRLHNASLEGELTLIEDAMVMDTHQTLMVPYQELLGDWRVEEAMPVAQPNAPFTLRFAQNGFALDIEANEESTWSLQNNRVLFYDQTPASDAEPSQMWFTRHLSPEGQSEYRYLVLNKAHQEVYYGTFFKVSGLPVEPPVSLPLSQQAQVQDPLLAQCVDASNVTHFENLTELYCLDSQQPFLSLQGLANFTNLQTVMLANVQLAELQANELPSNLHSLYLSSSHIDNLALNGLMQLTTLEVTNSSLNQISIDQLTQLKSLNLSNNQLLSVDVSALYALESLNVTENQLTELDITNLTQLVSLKAGGNSLSQLNMINNTQLKEVAVWENQLTSLEVGHLGLLEYLYVGDNQLPALNVQNNIYLKILKVDNNQLTSLDVTGNLKLEELWVGSNQLTALDVSPLTLLYALTVSFNQIGTLDLSNNTEMSKLNAESCQLTTLDLSSLPLLQELQVSNNQLSVLDLSQNPELTWLIANDNQLATIDTAHLSQLLSLSLNKNKLTSLDVSNNLNLIQMVVEHNQLTTLDVRTLGALNHLNVSTNQLASLDVSNNRQLQMLYVNDNKLANIDISQLDKLTDFGINNNGTLALDVSMNPQLVNLQTMGNLLTELELRQLGKLEHLDVTGNQITTLDVSQNPSLTWFYASNNELSTVSGIEALRKQAAILLTENPLNQTTKDYLTNLQQQGYSYLYF